jgi:hypothetical protein
MVAALTEVGFTDPAACSFCQDWRLGNADHYIESILSGTVRTRAALASQSGAAVAEVRSHIADYLSRFRTRTGELALPMPAMWSQVNLAMARSPCFVAVLRVPQGSQVSAAFSGNSSYSGVVPMSLSVISRRRIRAIATM